MDIEPPVTTLRPPEGLFDKRSGLSFRVQESIHGHRFLNEQDAYMVVLETLSVCRSRPLGSVRTNGDEHEKIGYEVPVLRKLRYLLFEDRHLEEIAADETIPHTERWRRWKKAASHAFPDGDDAPHERHFDYLDAIFEEDFDALLQAVRLARSLEIDVIHSRRWSSRFLAPTGPELLLHDFDVPSKDWSPDRRFFGRGGEIVYLMLNRSANPSQLASLIEQRLLSRTDPMNMVARALRDPSEAGENPENPRKKNLSIGYLPMASHPAYDRMAQDWTALLSLDRLPSTHLFEPLFRITGLNLVRYLAERAAEVCGAPTESILADFTDGEQKSLRTRSKDSLNRHRTRADDAVRIHIEETLNASPDWAEALKSSSKGKAARVLQDLFALKKPDDTLSPEKQKRALIADAQGRSKNNANAYILKLAKDVGLATARQRVGAWFAVDDAMLTALVLANVEESLELGEFTQRIHERYGIIAGPDEARAAYRQLPVDVEELEANLSALEARMTGLGLTQRLSDDCAFVFNPYRSHHE